MTNTAFIISFLTSAYNSPQTGNVERNEVCTLHHNLYPKIVRCLHLGTTDHFGTTDYSLTPFNLTNFIQQSHALGIDTAGILNILIKYTAGVQQIAMRNPFLHFFLPVAEGLGKQIETANRSPTSGEKAYVSQLLVKWVEHVRAAAQPPRDWSAKTTIRCSCADCDLLRRFINDPDKDVEGNGPKSQGALGSTTRQILLQHNHRRQEFSIRPPSKKKSHIRL